jgi:hypothetical protein
MHSITQIAQNKSIKGLLEWDFPDVICVLKVCRNIQQSDARFAEIRFVRIVQKQTAMFATAVGTT